MFFFFNSPEQVIISWAQQPCLLSSAQPGYNCTFEHTRINSAMSHLGPALNQHEELLLYFFCQKALIRLGWPF